MRRIQRWLEKTYNRRIANNFDSIGLVIGGEGVGKSTFMLESVWLYEQIRGRQPEVDAVLERLAHDDRERLRELLLNSDKRDPVVANDAAHILYKKEAMKGEQIETERSLLDVRIFNFFILLGYQDWSDVTDQLQRRRAHVAFRIPRRGVVHGYSRSSLDEVYDTGEWPSPDLKDTFPSLEGTELWRRFEELDEQRKTERLEVEDDVSESDIYRREQIKTALRAVEPWDDDAGMTQKDAAKLIDYSDSWISERVQDYKDGMYRDLLGEHDAPTS